MRKKQYQIVAGIVVLAIIAAGLATVFMRTGQAKADAGGMPRFQHIFYIMMENQAYNEIIGNASAPNINALANQYTLATNYYGVTHPSEPNYVAAVGGSFFTVSNTSSPLIKDIDFSGDNAYYCSPTGPLPDCAGTTGDHQIDAPSLFSQLEMAGLSWKTYQQSIPSIGYTGLYYPSGVVPGAQDKLYASKHNPIMNFLAFYGPAPTSASFTPNAAQQAELNKMVPDTQLAADLASGDVPALSFIVPDQCHDMHGTVSCPSGAALIQAGDTYVSKTVNAIMSSSTWQRGNNAIVITWDENDFTSDDCNANVPVASNGCQVPTIVIANHGPRGLKYNVASNHYALLLSIETAFGLGCLEQACPSSGSNVQAMTPMFHR
jgi:phosphatidylinositol-3-phosphatase